MADGGSMTIYHNPRCSKSRAVLQMLRDAGEEPEIVEYLKEPLSEMRLAELLRAMDLPARGLLRSKEARFKELELGDGGLSDDELIVAMASNPSLIERPIVVRGDRAMLCRPPELVLELLADS